MLDDATNQIGTNVGVHAGFPNPASERSRKSLDIQKLLVTSPSSTYFFRVRGHNWHRLGIYDGDLAIIDRSKTPQNGKPVLFWSETGELCIMQWQPGIYAHIWGVITAIIHQY
jgi:hypothetical protein